ncbi:MAG: SAM-dependent methyltransferase [Blautia massiliensis (ex Durand et al. 2017)]
MTDKNISVQLSMRLRAIAGMVTKGNRLADVGCDHGYLSIWLVSEKNSSVSHCHGCTSGTAFKSQGEYYPLWP